MRIKFNSITINNFMSFGHTKYVFDSLGYILVKGKNTNTTDCALSNGAGKSSLFEAIIWALTGETTRGTKQVVNKFGDDGSLVELDCDIDGNNLLLIRTKDHSEHKSNLKIYIDGVDKSGKGIRDTEKIFESLYPDITSQFLGSVIILGQGIPYRFTNNSPSGRKEVLEKLTKSDFMIEEIKNKVSLRKKRLTNEMTELKTELGRIEFSINFYKDSLMQNESKLDELYNEVNYDLVINDYNEKLFGINKELQDRDNEKTLLDFEVKKQTKLKEELEYYWRNKIEELNLSITDKNIVYAGIEKEFNTKIAYLESELNKLRAITDTCPTCGQKLLGVQKPDTSNVELELINAKVSKQETLLPLEEDLTKLKVELHSAKVHMTTEVSDMAKDLNACVFKVNQCIDTITAITKEQHHYETQLAEATFKKESFEDRKAEYQANIIEYRKTLNDLYETYTNKQKEYSILSERDSIISKMETFLKRDFRTFLLENIISYIDTCAKEYCKLIFNTTKLNFINDGNLIRITYCDKDYENLSGGEKQRVDIIIQLALRKMLTDYMNFTCNILVVDEVFDGLDNIGCEKVLDLISEISDIEQIFIISHRSDLPIVSDSIVTISKDENGISTIL